MSLEKKVVIDKIEVLEDGQIQIRQATNFLVDGKEMGRSYQRWVLTPGDDVANQTVRVRNIARVVHTPEVISAFIEKKKKATSGL